MNVHKMSWLSYCEIIGSKLHALVSEIISNMGDCNRLNIDLANLYIYAMDFGRREVLTSSRLKHCIIFIICNVFRRIFALITEK